MMSARLENSGKKTLIVACVDDHPKAIVLLRIARNHAQVVGGKWRVVYVETPSQLQQIEDRSQERMLRLLTMAQQMGGETSHIEADTVEKGILQMLEAEKDRISLLIVGSTEGERKWFSPRAMPWKRIMQTARQHDIAVEMVPLAGQRYRSTMREILRRIRLPHLLYALASVAVAYGVALFLQWRLPPALFRINDQNVALIFMTACAFAAGRFGLLPGLVASVASFLTVNYYFTAPFHIIKLSSVTDLLNMAIFLSAALLISLFTSQTRGHAERSARRALSTQALFMLYRIASDAFSRQQALEQLQKKLTRMLDMDVAFFLPLMLNPQQLEAAYPTPLALEEGDRTALEACWREMKTTGLASPTNPGTQWRFEPMMAPGGEIGVLGIRPRSRKQIDAWFGSLIAAIADQTAAVLERIEMERSMETTRIREEREKLRSMLLSSVSHDLKTPLASIIGALGIYRHQGKVLTANKREELIDTALAEAERLESFITNILDMTRLESGKIKFRQEWTSLEDMIKEATKRLEHRCERHRLLIHPLAQNIEVYMDNMMTIQVIQNIVDNACKYTPSGTLVEMRMQASKEDGFTCEIRDHGPGLPPEKMERVFDKYARLQKEDSQVAGTGLGLAICKAIMEAQGGAIKVRNHPSGGAIFTLHFPQWRKTDTTKHVA